MISYSLNEFVLENTERRSLRYRGALGPTNWELIQPLKRSLSTCTQSRSRFVTLKRVPLGGVPTTVPVVEGADRMCTPGRCTKAISWFCDAGIVRVTVFPAGAAAAIWGEASTGTEGGGSGQAIAVRSAKDGSGF
jgi:hypothetical protein